MITIETFPGPRMSMPQSSQDHRGLKRLDASDAVEDPKQAKESIELLAHEASVTNREETSIRSDDGSNASSFFVQRRPRRFQLPKKPRRFIGGRGDDDGQDSD